MEPLLDDMGKRLGVFEEKTEVLITQEKELQEALSARKAAEARRAQSDGEELLAQVGSLVGNSDADIFDAFGAKRIIPTAAGHYMLNPGDFLIEVNTGMVRLLRVARASTNETWETQVLAWTEFGRRTYSGS